MAFARVAVDESEELRPWTEIEQQSNLDRESESCQLVCARPPIYGLEEPESEPIVNAMKHQRIWRVSSCSKRDPSACVREGFIRVSLR